MSHITAGDVAPIAYKTETTYGTPTGSWAYYADLKGDGGSFTPTDNPNPYIAWKSGSRAFNFSDYVRTNLEAGYTNILEVADTGTCLESIIKNALGDTSTQGTPRLPSRATRALIKQGQVAGNYDAIEYVGCKTDRLEIRADQPGGIVEFAETVLASNSGGISYSGATTPTLEEDEPAVQWVGGVTIESTPIYPQNFRISINNNLGRVKGPVPSLMGSATPDYGSVALTEGRLEMELQMDVWMEDLEFILSRGSNFSETQHLWTIEMTLGLAVPVTLTMGAALLADGQHHGIIQDKQMATLRYRIAEMALS